MNDKLLKSIALAIQIILLLLVLAYGITGFGITQGRIVSMLTFGLLSQPMAFLVHDNLLIPFIIFLLLHIFYKPLAGVLFKVRK
jgi:hypothetical protein